MILILEAQDGSLAHKEAYVVAQSNALLRLLFIIMVFAICVYLLVLQDCSILN